MISTRRFAAAAVLIGAAIPAMTCARAAEPYRIGYLVDASGPMQGIFKTGLDGFKLYMDQVNAAGGIHGRPVAIDVRDVQIDPGKSASSAQELASNGAIAIAGLSLSSTHMPVYNAMARLKVPVITGFPVNLSVILPPKPKAGVYGVGAVVEILGSVAGKMARQMSPEGKRFACTVFESPGGIIACDHAVAAAKAAGFSSAEKILFPVTQRDFRPIAEKIAQSNPDVLLTIFGRGRTLTFFPAIAEAGYRGKILSAETGTGDDELREAAKAAPGIDIYSYSRYVSGGQGEGPQVEALEKAARQAGIPEVLAFHSGGWIMGAVIADALTRCERPCDPVRLDAALANTRIDGGGLTREPIVFTPTDHFGPSSYELYHYDRARDQVVSTGHVEKASSQLQ